jgi:hypothetical protein
VSGPLRSASRLRARDGEHVVVRGTYWVQELGAHRLKVPDGRGGYRTVTRVAHVRLRGGDVALGHRPDDEMASLDGRVVEVAGHLYFPPPPDFGRAGRRPMPTLTDITSIEPSASDVD